MKKTILLFLAVNFGVSHAATVESRPLNVDSRSSDTLGEARSAWTTDAKTDYKKNITEFQTKYNDIKSGISIIYVIKMSSDIQSFYNNWGDRYDACDVAYVRFEFDGKKFKDDKTYLSSGRIWTNNSRYFDISRAVKSDEEGNYYFIIDSDGLASYLNSEKDIKITSDSTLDLWLPFVGAKVQLQKAQDQCKEHLHTEKNKLMARVAQAEVEAKAKREKEAAETNRKNAEIKRQMTAQMKKPDVQIGMTRQQVIKNTRWGVPMKINSTKTKYGTSEQWVYWGYKYLYFENGKLVAIQQL